VYVREFLPSYAWSDRSVSTLPLVRDMLREEAVIRVMHAATVSTSSTICNRMPLCLYINCCNTLLLHSDKMTPYITSSIGTIHGDNCNEASSRGKHLSLYALHCTVLLLLPHTFCRLEAVTPRAATVQQLKFNKLNKV
jgi:hypothetical protein